jgi:NAD(P)-dependent dehydrogenase (short-subunit alcohol dehydrogenase family)
MGSKRLEGKRAVITGAAGGIARATALAFAAQGAIVSLADQDQAGVEKTVAKVVSQGAKAFVTDYADTRKKRNVYQSLPPGSFGATRRNFRCDHIYGQ